MNGTAGTPIRDYIKEGDWVQAESRLAGVHRLEEGLVKRDIEGELRIEAADRDPNGPDGLPVNATWVNIIIWKAAS